MAIFANNEITFDRQKGGAKVNLVIKIVYLSSMQQANMKYILTNQSPQDPHRMTNTDMISTKFELYA